MSPYLSHELNQFDQIHFLGKFCRKQIKAHCLILRSIRLHWDHLCSNLFSWFTRDTRSDVLIPRMNLLVILVAKPCV